MCEYIRITLETTSTESPWGDGIIERNNQTITIMLNKIIVDTNCSLYLDLCCQ